MPNSLAHFLADCLHAVALATAASLARDFTPATYRRIDPDLLDLEAVVCVADLEAIWSKK